jgi:hypothetical protein
MFLTFCMISHRHAQGWFDISLLSGCAGSSVCMLLCRVAPVLPRIAKQDARSVLGWSAVEVAAASHHTLLCWHAQVLAGVLPRLVDIRLSYPPHAPPYSSYLACTIPIVTWHLTSTGCLLDVPCVQLGLHLSVGGMGCVFVHTTKLFGKLPLRSWWHEPLCCLPARGVAYMAPVCMQASQGCWLCTSFAPAGCLCVMSCHWAVSLFSCALFAVAARRVNTFACAYIIAAASRQCCVLCQYRPVQVHLPAGPVDRLQCITDLSVVCGVTSESWSVTQV